MRSRCSGRPLLIAETRRVAASPFAAELPLILVQNLDVVPGPGHVKPTYAADVIAERERMRVLDDVTSRASRRSTRDGRSNLEARPSTHRTARDRALGWNQRDGFN